MKNIITFVRANDLVFTKLICHIHEWHHQGERFVFLDKSAGKISTKRKLGTPWEIDGVYCDPAELTSFLHYAHYRHPSANSCSYR